MPLDRNIRVRLKFLDECLRKEALNIYSLHEKLNRHLEIHGFQQVSIRTLRNDIEVIESEFGAQFVPDLWDSKKKLYRYLDPNFSINNLVGLSDRDKRLLGDAAKLLSQVTGLPGDYIFEKVKTDICNILNLNTLDSNVIFYDSVSDLRGLKKWWQPCYNAILQRKVLCIDYQEFLDAPSSYTVSPHALKEFNRRWYLICTNHRDVSRYYNLPLDRVLDIRLADGSEPFLPQSSDINDYYNDVFGITNLTSDPVEHVRFVAYGKTAKYIETKPFCPKCSFKWLSDSELEVCLNVKINYELEHQLLSWADSIKILEPERLVERHKNLLKKALENY